MSFSDCKVGFNRRADSLVVVSSNKLEALQDLALGYCIDLLVKGALRKAQATQDK
jgi:hypothetical protein